jgi:OPT family small oligopeptide transporter
VLPVLTLAAQVRASVSNIDDPDMPAFTLRMFVLAILLNTCAATANILFNLRIPSPQVSPIIVQLVAYPLGKLLARILPIRVFHLPRFLGGGAWSMNPGSFNIKEHALITLTANVAIGQAYAFSSLISLDSAVFYNAPKPQSFQVLYMLSSQLIGFGFSGFCVPFLVTPASMIWPQNLVTATVLNTLHAEEDGLDGTMTRFRYFNILAGAAFLWFFFPNFIFSALSYFNWVCWIWPNSHVVNTVFGTTSGLGMSILTFDWSQIAYIGSPLVAPWWAECNVFAGFVFFYWIAAPILYYKNVFNFARLPFNSSSTWDRFGERYDVLRVLGSRSDLNVAEYEAYSPLYLSVSLYFAYWTGFAAATSVLVHTVLYHGKTLWKGIRRIRTEEDDIHAKFMRRYPTVPDWWYALVLLITFAISVVVVEVWDTDLPVWALLIAILVAAVYALPAGFIYAMTGSLPATNIIGELVAGYMMPRRAVPNMVFKVYCVQALSSGLNFVQDLKVGHYMKVNPRATFAMQLIATGWTAVVQWAVKQFIFGHVERVCDPAQPQCFTCPHANVFFTSSIIWGAVGPDLLFGRDSIYHPIYLGLLVGAVLPIPIWLLARRFPRTPIKFISTPIFFNGLSFIPPASGLNYASWFLTGFIFQYLIRRRNFRWWSKYNFVTSAALDLGTVASVRVPCAVYVLQLLTLSSPQFIFMFLTLALPRNGELYVNWWGNNVVGNNIDSQRTPYLPTGPDGFAPPPPPVHR